MRLVRDPDADAALAFFRRELAALAEGRGRMVQAFADCVVEYRGRARSDLHRGERLVLLKPDGTLLVHTSASAKPVNWQPPGAAMSVERDTEGNVVLVALRRKPEELVRVTFHVVSLLVAAPLSDGARLALTGTEDDLQQLLFERPDLVEQGFRPRLRERSTARGFHDLDGDDAAGRRLVVEVKRVTAGVADAQQLWRYVERLRDGAADEARVRGMLVAPRVADRARALLADHGLEWKELDWADVMPRVESMRRGGQVGLARFSDAPPASVWSAATAPVDNALADGSPNAANEGTPSALGLASAPPKRSGRRA